MLQASILPSWNEEGRLANTWAAGQCIWARRVAGSWINCVELASRRAGHTFQCQIGRGATRSSSGQEQNMRHASLPRAGTGTGNGCCSQSNFNANELKLLSNGWATRRMSNLIVENENWDQNVVVACQCQVQLLQPPHRNSNNVSLPGNKTANEVLYYCGILSFGTPTHGKRNCVCCPLGM